MGHQGLHLAPHNLCSDQFIFNFKKQPTKCFSVFHFFQPLETKRETSLTCLCPLVSSLANSPTKISPFHISSTLTNACSDHMLSSFFLSRQTQDMKSMKGRFLKKLMFIPHINTLKHGLVSHHNSADKFSSHNLQIPSSVYTKEDRKRYTLVEAVTDNTGISEHITALKDEEQELEINSLYNNGKDNITPSIDKVLAMDGAQVGSEIITKEYHNATKEEYSSLSHFEEKCPPEGSKAVILYTTSLRSIRKTFEDCHTIQFLLESFKVKFYERDVSMHLEFREELWRILGGRVIPPRLFIKGRYIGGADEVVSLHEQGKLKKLLEGIPKLLSSTPCTGCGNKRFVVCFNCNGSRKVFTDGENDEMYVRCLECNENGLVKCKICSC